MQTLLIQCPICETIVDKSQNNSNNIKFESKNEFKKYLIPKNQNQIINEKNLKKFKKIKKIKK